MSPDSLGMDRDSPEELIISSVGSRGWGKPSGVCFSNLNVRTNYLGTLLKWSDSVGLGLHI